MKLGTNQINANDHENWKTIATTTKNHHELDLRIIKDSDPLGALRGRIYRYEYGELTSVIEYQFLSDARQHLYNWQRPHYDILDEVAAIAS